MRFSDKDLEVAMAEFSANAVVRVVPGAGHNKDITVYGVGNGTVQNPSDGNSGNAKPGNVGD